MRGFELTQRHRRNLDTVKSPPRVRKPKEPKGCRECAVKDAEIIRLRALVQLPPYTWVNVPVTTFSPVTMPTTTMTITGAAQWPSSSYTLNTAATVASNSVVLVNTAGVPLNNDSAIQFTYTLAYPTSSSDTS